MLQHYNSRTQENYFLEILGEKFLFEDELHMVKRFAKKTLQKLSNKTKFNTLKITYRQHGEDTSHHRKIEMKCSLHSDNKTLNFKKDISPGTSDEIYNNKIKSPWNITKITQVALKNLEKEAFQESKKH